MYKIRREGQFPLELPIEDFEKRFRRLFVEGKKVVYIKNEFDNSTFRYRTYNIMQALEGNEDFIITCFLPTELKKVYEHIDRIDIVILQRAMWDINIENFIFSSKQKNIPVIYDIDDLIYNPKYVPLYLNNLGIISETPKNFDVHFNFASKYYALASKCDGFIVTNEYLGGIVEKDFSKAVWTIPNFLNREQEKHSEFIRETREKDNTKFMIGYFSGSPSHKFDLEIVVDALEALLEKYEDIYFKIVGFIEIPIKLRKFVKRVILKPFVSYEELQYEIGEVDLNIIPLQNNVFNNCKSELKFFEAGIVNVISCCSPTYIYKQIVEDGKNGFLCSDGNWFSTIEKIYKEKGQTEITSKAFQTSSTLYGVTEQKEKITKVYREILTGL